MNEPVDKPEPTTLGAMAFIGYADTQPVMPNTTDAGRAKNRQVEVRVTK